MFRVDLNEREATPEEINEATLRKYAGGFSLGVKSIYDEIPPGVAWADPANRLFPGSGHLGVTRIGGSGAIAVVTESALINGIRAVMRSKGESHCDNHVKIALSTKE
jgi:aldehyde:ferredoxin oxidoreductase